MAKGSIKQIRWIGSSLDDLKAMPQAVRDVFGFALYQAQLGMKHQDAKPLKGFGGAGVLEVVESHHRNAYRCIYTVKLADVVYVLHVFQKKSTRGIRTSTHDLNLIRQRLAQVMEDVEEQRP